MQKSVGSKLVQWMMDTKLVMMETLIGLSYVVSSEINFLENSMVSIPLEERFAEIS